MPFKNSPCLSARGCPQNRITAAIPIACITLASLICAPVMADNENVAAAIDSSSSHWSGYLSATAASNTFAQSEPSSYQALSGNGRIAYRDDWGSLRLSSGGEVELHHNQSYFYDTFLEYRTPSKKLIDAWSYIGSAGVFLPTSHTSQENKLRAAPRIAGYLFYRPSKNWNFYLSPRFKYNAYKYETGRQGEHFVEHQIDLLADATWQFIDGWYLDVNGSYGMAKKFNTSRYDNRFTMSEEIGWEFAQNWVAAIGHNNTGSFYDPERGPSKGFEVYDKRSSVFYLSITKYL
ncbi:hypothetical protein AB4298_11115 [Shewanella sp. 10N.261.52.F9]|uniref:hypothetical protein n=1 Tax=Shewanella sp. 10N.261.52.F9 TaxID=3229684 RepID=UPI00354C55F5